MWPALRAMGQLKPVVWPATHRGDTCYYAGLLTPLFRLATLYCPTIMNNFLPPTEWKISDQPVAYPAAMAVMEERVAEIIVGNAPEMVWLLEHPPLYTAGTSAQAADLLQPDQFPVYASGRGGQYTYHGPGQRVAYVMQNLVWRERDVRLHIWRLEAWLIATLAALGVQGERRENRVGIWVAHPDGREEKIAAIGVRVRKWVTYHGIALNVAPNLAHYRAIVPCGLGQFGVTSLAALGINTSMAHVDTALRQQFPLVFK
jgi:lipoyl(octanoyl) transferase